MFRFPVSLERVDADGTVLSHIRVEDFGEEKSLRWTGGEIPAQH